MTPEERRRAHAKRRAAYRAKHSPHLRLVDEADGAPRTPGPGGPAHAHAVEGDDHEFDLGTLPETIRHEQAMGRVRREEAERMTAYGIPWEEPDPVVEAGRRARLRRQMQDQAAGRTPESADTPEWQALTFAEKMRAKGFAGDGPRPKPVAGWSSLGGLFDREPEE